MTEQPPFDDDDLREWFWRCSLNLQNAAIKSVPQIAHPCDADHFADDAMRRVDALIARRVSAETERCAQCALDGGALLAEASGDMRSTTPAKYAADLAKDIADAIRAPAERPSERDAAYLAKLSECEDLRAGFETVERQCRDANRALRQARAEHAALLARLREPDVREAVIEALRKSRRPSIKKLPSLDDLAPGIREMYEREADAALTKIAEMLK